MQFIDGLWYGKAMQFTDPTFRNGDRAVVSYQGVTAGATFIAGIGQQRYTVKLDGTNQVVTVPGSTLSRETQE